MNFNGAFIELEAADFAALGRILSDEANLDKIGAAVLRLQNPSKPVTGTDQGVAASAGPVVFPERDADGNLIDGSPQISTGEERTEVVEGDGSDGKVTKRTRRTKAEKAAKADAGPIPPLPPPPPPPNPPTLPLAPPPAMLAGRVIDAIQKFVDEGRTPEAMVEWVYAYGIVNAKDTPYESAIATIRLMPDDKLKSLAEPLGLLDD
jgi:hypothetical protein